MNASIGSTMGSKAGGPNRSRSLPLGGRRTWLALAAVALIGAAALNWSWLVAVGIAPLLVAFAPCAAMCALGLCMKSGADGCKGQAISGEPTPTLVPVRAGGPGRA